MTKMSRRDLLRAGVGGAAVAAIGTASGCVPAWVPPSNGSVFSLGVASGLHSPDSVVLWTRVDPAVSATATEVRWRIATDQAMSNVVRTGTTIAEPERDHTVKVLVDGLVADRSYWYQFDLDGNPSPIGRARTLPDPHAEVTSLRLAAASCQNWSAGWYHAWADIATQELDAVLFLGDYIYESGSNPIIGVRSDPIGLAETKAQYWAKYRLYRSDPNMQAGHAAHPLVPIWDDHELVNNFSRHTILAEPQRAADAFDAWFDYMPVWPIDGHRIYRSIRWGNLAVIPMLDTRQYRDHTANGFIGIEHDPLLGVGAAIHESHQPGRSILGDAQRSWLIDTIDEAHDDGVRWKVLGNQVMMTPTRGLDLESPALRELLPHLAPNDGIYINMDSWNSYLWERQQLLDHWWANQTTGLTVLTGDIHSFWVADQRLDLDDPYSPRVTREYVTGSVSSQTPNILGTDDFGIWMEQGPLGWNPRFDYVNFRENGYGRVVITPESLAVTMRYTRAAQQYWGVYDGPTFTDAHAAR